MKALMNKVVGFMKEEEGASAVEYALLVALIAAVIIVTVKFLGTSASSTFKEVGAQINSAS